MTSNTLGGRRVLYGVPIQMTSNTLGGRRVLYGVLIQMTSNTLGGRRDHIVVGTCAISAHHD
jgi:hypothetical protein